MNHLTGFLGPAYLWVKAAHLTFVIFWLAGLFLLPRFYVYHQETAVGSPEDRAWIEREARVRSIILTPAMLVVWILGVMLALDKHVADAKLDTFDADSVFGSHAAVLFGYGPDHFLLRSSWGTDWGEQGYARMSLDYAAQAVIESYGVIV